MLFCLKAIIYFNISKIKKKHGILYKADIAEDISGFVFG